MPTQKADPDSYRAKEPALSHDSGTHRAPLAEHLRLDEELDFIMEGEGEEE